MITYQRVELATLSARWKSSSSSRALKHSKISSQPVNATEQLLPLFGKHDDENGSDLSGWDRIITKGGNRLRGTRRKGRIFVGNYF